MTFLRFMLNLLRRRNTPAFWGELGYDPDRYPFKE